MFRYVQLAIVYSWGRDTKMNREWKIRKKKSIVTSGQSGKRHEDLRLIEELTKTLILWIPREKRAAGNEWAFRKSFENCHTFWTRTTNQLEFTSSWSKKTYKDWNNFYRVKIINVKIDLISLLLRTRGRERRHMASAANDSPSRSPHTHSYIHVLLYMDKYIYIPLKTYTECGSFSAFHFREMSSPARLSGRSRGVAKL